MRPRIIFFGFSDVGFKSLKLLIERKCDVVAVFTHNTDAHETQWFETAESLAQKYNIPVYKPESLKGEEWKKLVEELKPDLILSLYYRNFIPPAIFTQAKLGAYNMHGSYLPRYRGRAPLNWSIINGESHCGATLHVLEKGFDTGDIVDKEKVNIAPDEYVETVLPRISAAAIKVLDRSLDSLLAGSPKLEKQNEAEVSYFGKRTPEDGRIDFSKNTSEIFNLIRGVSKPFPGAFFDYENKRYTIWKASIINETPKEETGAVISENPLKIACSNGYILSEDFDKKVL